MKNTVYITAPALTPHGADRFSSGVSRFHAGGQCAVPRGDRTRGTRVRAARMPISHCHFVKPRSGPLTGTTSAPTLTRENRDGIQSAGGSRSNWAFCGEEGPLRSVVGNPVSLRRFEDVVS